VFGEAGLFTPDAMRSASAVCAQPSVMYSVSKDDVIRLRDQKPKFAFFIARQLSRNGSESVDAMVPLASGRNHEAQAAAGASARVLPLKERLKAA
jgi:CRP-like cAMP-binding protein